MQNEVQCHEENFLNKNDKQKFNDMSLNNGELHNFKTNLIDKNYIFEHQIYKNNGAFNEDTIRKPIKNTYKSLNICSKLKKNFFLMLAIIFFLFLYFVYMRVK